MTPRDLRPGDLFFLKHLNAWMMLIDVRQHKYHQTGTVFSFVTCSICELDLSVLFSRQYNEEIPELQSRLDD